MSGIEIAAAAAAVAAAGVSAVASIRQGQAARNFAEFNAKVAENEAIATRQAARFEERRVRERTQRFIASQRAAAGKSGIVVNEGSPLLAQVESAAEGELDALAIRRSATIAEARAKSRASAARIQGRVAQQQSQFQAGASLLGGVSRAASLLAE